MSDECGPSALPTVTSPLLKSGITFYLGATEPVTSLEGDIWIWEPEFKNVPWTHLIVSTHRQRLDYTLSLARKYTQRPRGPQIARQRRLIEQYGTAYRWPPQYRYPNHRYP